MNSKTEKRVIDCYNWFLSQGIDLDVSLELKEIHYIQAQWNSRIETADEEWLEEHGLLVKPKPVKAGFHRLFTKLVSQ